MNWKKILVWGLAITAVMGIAVAGVVSYLSNSVQTSITINSPLSLVGEGTLDISGYGGETKTQEFTLVNNANATISGNVHIVITNTVGVTCSELSSVLINGNAVSSCISNDGNTISMSGTYTIAPLTTDDIIISYTFIQNAIGVYNINTQVTV